MDLRYLGLEDLEIRFVVTGLDNDYVNTVATFTKGNNLTLG